MQTAERAVGPRSEITVKPLPGDGYFFFMKKIINVTTIEKAVRKTALSCINKFIVS